MQFGKIALAIVRLWGAMSVVCGIAYLVLTGVLFLAAMGPLSAYAEWASSLIVMTLIYGVMGVAAGFALIAAARWIAAFAVRNLFDRDEPGVFS
ncbi:hypothetical protein [Dongia sp.]|uniref:hypothetical protein n=1 Tax=Dongia sp. TaxID=1977262 RepID=UPI0037506482